MAIKKNSTWKIVSINIAYTLIFALLVSLPQTLSITEHWLIIIMVYGTVSTYLNVILAHTYMTLIPAFDDDKTVTTVTPNQ